MKWLQEGKWITTGFGVAILLMGAVSVTSYQNATQLVRSANQVKQTNEILDQLTDLSAILADAESRRWGYILFEDADELERYHTAIQSLQPILDTLEQPLSDTPIQQQRLRVLTALITERIALLQQSIALYQDSQNQDSQTSILATEPIVARSKQNQAAIRQVINALEAKEEDLLQRQLRHAQSNLQFRMLIEPLGTLLTFAVLFGVYFLLSQQMHKRQEAESQQRTLAQAKELSELKLQLFSMVSHEFRTPLSLILGSSQLLDETLKPHIDPTKLKNLYRIQASAKSMTQLLSDILTLARADAGRLEYQPEWVELQTFCLNLVEDLQLVGDAGRSITFTQHGSRTHAHVDEKLLYAILSNLLSNALKFSPPDSVVEFKLMSEPTAVVFQVSDRGIGIPTDEQPYIYEMFVRGSNAKTQMGTGLGLAVVQRCLELHQGEIVLESQMGQGTTFTVKIPQNQEVEPLRAERKL